MSVGPTNLDAIHIRRAVERARNMMARHGDSLPANTAARCIDAGLSAAAVKAMLFDALFAADAGSIAFRRAPLAAVMRSARRPL